MLECWAIEYHLLRGHEEKIKRNKRMAKNGVLSGWVIPMRLQTSFRASANYP